ncbi:MAG: hypothetical protein HY270_05855, partial [Deltaproteobacteria bacterium]|nr:hypothetical protein [Deltaproteobacteria bacterium]
WKSDGTGTGTVLLKDINPGSGSSDPSNLINVAGTLFFTASDGMNGTELWKSDGTASGTVLVRDIGVGSNGSDPTNLTNVNGTLFFTACDTRDLFNDPADCELWKSDGTAAGTVLVKNIFPGAYSYWLRELTNVNGTLFFKACDTADPFGNPANCELWKSDGTSAGTVIVKDINPGSRSSNPRYLSNVGGALFFSACDDQSGCELWKSDGTASGTVMFADVLPGPASSYPGNFTQLGSDLIFVATNDAYASELWRITTAATCGNGNLDAGEQCDDGNLVNGDGCNIACGLEGCRDGYVEGSEQCDDGNAIDADTCKNDCALNVCGDGVSDPTVEACDDGNTNGGDGCSSSCQIESCFQCSGQPSSCAPAADGTTCNDGNGCSISDVCSSGTCTGTNAADGTACEDGNACSIGDTCQAGGCQAGPPLVCTAFDQCYDVGTCNPMAGCSNPHKPDGTACNDGDGCPSDTCQVGACQPVSCPSVDAMVLLVRPQSLTIVSGQTLRQKTLSIGIRNLDALDRTIGLAVDASDCPAGLAGAIDCDAKTPGAQSSILVPAGKTVRAKLPLTIRSADFTSLNFKAPQRCTLRLTASAAVAGGSNDPIPSNNTAVVELNVVDKNDPEQIAPPPHETTLASAAPVTLTLKTGRTFINKTLHAKIGNADYVPAELPGDAIALTAAANCSGLTLGTPVCETRTQTNTAVVTGGGRRTCAVPAFIDGSRISTPNHRGSQRCTVSLSAQGPSNPDGTPSNNRTELVIDVVDKND